MAGAGTIPKFAFPYYVGVGINDMIVLEERIAGVFVQGQATIDGLGFGSRDFFHRHLSSVVNDAPAEEPASSCLERQLKRALEDASEITGGNRTYTVDVLSTGQIEVYTADGDFRLRWDLSFAEADVWGFDQVSTPSLHPGLGHIGVWDCTSPNHGGRIWLPGQAYTDDTEDMPGYGVVQVKSMSGRIRTQRWGVGRTRREILCDYLPPRKVFIAEEVLSGEAFERAWAIFSTGERFELARRWDTHPADFSTYVIDDPRWLSEWPVTIPHGTIREFNIRFPMNGWVASS